MKTNHEVPLVFHKLKEKFGVEWGSIIIAHYPDIYCAVDIPEQKYVHEKVHLDRQKLMGVGEWWGRYLSDDAFRLNEEVLAYRAEVEWIKKNVATRNERRYLLNKIYTDLSSYVYGHIVSEDEAKKLLTA